MTIDEEYLRAQCKLVIDGEEVDWDRDTVAAHLLTMLDERARLRGLVKEAQWAIDDDHGPPFSCPWCMSEEKRGHLETCPAFTPSGEVR